MEWVGRWRNGPLRVGHEEPGLAWSRQEHQSHPCSHSASERPFGNRHLMIDLDFNLHGTALHCCSSRSDCSVRRLYCTCKQYCSGVQYSHSLIHSCEATRTRLEILHCTALHLLCTVKCCSVEERQPRWRRTLRRFTLQRTSKRCEQQSGAAHLLCRNRSSAAPGLRALPELFESRPLAGARETSQTRNCVRHRRHRANILLLYCCAPSSRPHCLFRTRIRTQAMCVRLF